MLTTKVRRREEGCGTSKKLSEYRGNFCLFLINLPLRKEGKKKEERKRGRRRGEKEEFTKGNPLLIKKSIMMKDILPVITSPSSKR